MTGTSCMGCASKENQQHLVTCNILKRKYWREIEDLLLMLGVLDQRDDKDTYLLFGRVSNEIH